MAAVAAAAILRGPKGVVEHATHERGRAFGTENAFQTRGEVHGQIQQYRVDRTALGPAQCVITALIPPASFDRRPFFHISLGHSVHVPVDVRIIQQYTTYNYNDKYNNVGMQ